MQKVSLLTEVGHGPEVLFSEPRKNFFLQHIQINLTIKYPNKVPQLTEVGHCPEVGGGPHHEVQQVAQVHQATGPHGHLYVQQVYSGVNWGWAGVAAAPPEILCPP